MKIKSLDEDNYYKYLDILQADIKHAEVKKARMPNVNLKDVQVFVIIIFIQAFWCYFNAQQHLN